MNSEQFIFHKVNIKYWNTTMYAGI